MYYNKLLIRGSSSMYATSTQSREWIFENDEVLEKRREEVNANYIQTCNRVLNDSIKRDMFLTPEQEKILLFKYELSLKEFCKKFQPPMPACVIGTAIHYFKRFYINNSVMQFVPKEIMVTCIFLACKVEEFNVSMMQFLSNIRGDREKANEVILNTELLVMQQLNFHLTIHNPYRPVEGLLIDIKTRYPALHDPERLRPGIDNFLDKAYFTDAILLYAPSQIALAAVLYAASKLQENLDAYVTETLFEGLGNLNELITAVKNIRFLVKMVDLTANKNQHKMLEKKLEKFSAIENLPGQNESKPRTQTPFDPAEELYTKIDEALMPQSTDSAFDTKNSSASED